MKHIIAIIAFAFALTLTATAQDSVVSMIGPLASGHSLKVHQALESGVTPKAVQQQNLEFVVPELIVGGEWTSVIRLTNRSFRAIPKTNVYFSDNTGHPMAVAFQAVSCGVTCVPGKTIIDTGFSFFLNQGAIVEMSFSGGTDTRFGHGVIDICNGVQGTGSTCSSAGLYVEVLLRNRNATRPDFESVFPLEQPANLQYMLWDHRNYASTVLYLVNDNATATTVTLNFLNGLNQVIATRTIALNTLESQILTLPDIAPATIGFQGVLEIRGQNTTGAIALITATALRINASNSFTPIRAFVPAQ
jgi:hypothetical protein